MKRKRGDKKLLLKVVLQSFLHIILTSATKLCYNYVTKGVDIMPRIIPIKDLRNTNEISQMCKESAEPIYITKNGYGDMVIMSMEMYEQYMFLADVYSKLAAAEEQVKNGKVLDADESLARLRDKYNV